MEEEKKFKFNITIDNGIGLIIAGILFPILIQFGIWIVPIALGVFGLFQIVRGLVKEGVPNIGIAALIWILGHFFKGIINWIGVALVAIGVIVLIIAIIQKRKRKVEE